MPLAKDLIKKFRDFLSLQDQVAKQINVLIKTTGKEVRLFKKRVDQKEWKSALKKHTKLQEKPTISMTTINDLLGAEENGEERGDEEDLGTIEKNRKRKRREEEGEAEAEAEASFLCSRSSNGSG